MAFKCRCEHGAGFCSADYWTRIDHGTMVSGELDAGSEGLDRSGGPGEEKCWPAEADEGDRSSSARAEGHPQLGEDKVGEHSRLRTNFPPFATYNTRFQPAHYNLHHTQFNSSLTSLPNPLNLIMSDKVAGDAEKALGNEAYKARKFDEAADHYEKAWELNKDITYLNNLAGKLKLGREGRRARPWCPRAETSLGQLAQLEPGPARFGLRECTNRRASWY